MATAATSTVCHTGACSSSGPTATSRTLPNSTCSENQTVRFRITPTIAAVIAASAPRSARLPRSRSMYGAPRKIHRKQGT
jgi:hypothetical protein